MFGKVASDLQDISIAFGGISGTLNYISDYSDAFSGDEASGHYLAIKCEATDGAVITAEVVGGVHGEVTLDSDGLLVCRIANNLQSIRVTATKNGTSITQNYSLAGLNLA